jgi:hypothetical protein
MEGWLYRRRMKWVVCKTTGYGLHTSCSNSGKGNIFFFYTTSRPAMESAHPEVGTWGDFCGSKAAGGWSWLLTSISCRGQECWSCTSTTPYVFMTDCLVNYTPQVHIYLAFRRNDLLRSITPFSMWKNPQCGWSNFEICTLIDVRGVPPVVAL